MLKAITGTERSDQITMWARTAWAEALLIDNRVVGPFGWARSCSKYGSRRVAAGSGAVLRTGVAAPAVTGASRQAISRPGTIRGTRIFAASNIRNAPFSGWTVPGRRRPGATGELSSMV